jgi:hypothetical protein
MGTVKGRMRLGLKKLRDHFESQEEEVAASPNPRCEDGATERKELHTSIEPPKTYTR